MMLEENPLFHTVAVQSTESSQWTTTPHLLRAILVIPTLGDMYMTDDLGLILLLWWTDLY